MDVVLSPILHKCAAVYLDDVLIFSDSFEQHLIDLQAAFTLIKQANLRLNTEKCRFAMHETVFLGHKVSKSGIGPENSKISCLTELTSASNLKELQFLIGFFNYYRKFIPNFSEIANPICC